MRDQIGQGAIEGGAHAVAHAVGNLFKDAYNPASEFTKVDQNQSKALTVGEMCRAADQVVKDHFAKKVDGIANYTMGLDGNKNGTVSYDEFKKQSWAANIGANIEEQKKALFKKIDNNNDGKLTTGEVKIYGQKSVEQDLKREMAAAELVARVRFKKLDTDTNHLVSIDEFSKSKSSFLPDFSITHRGGVQEVEEIKGGAAGIGSAAGKAAGEALKQSPQKHQPSLKESKTETLGKVAAGAIEAGIAVTVGGVGSAAAGAALIRGGTLVGTGAKSVKH